ncbi:chitinase [Streptomyces sodiiphilus]|uniref:Chitinase n=1 Tax=Streptomyces sodiiphilus TaxID=226217 RepID=A0ABN2P3N3_9ACTN
MIRQRLKAMLAAFAVAGVLAVLLPMTSANATGASASAACATAWNPATVYWGGDTASHNGRNWRARWWTQNETPGGGSGVWADQGPCGGTEEPGEPNPGGFVVSEAQFNQMFPNRNPFYTYSGLTQALSAYPAFANTGDDTVKRREAAAFLANVSHETGGLVHIREQNEANYSHYCDVSQPYGCPAGQSAYYGRGPIQLSWNFNYHAAGNALGIDLLNNPWLVEQNASIAWQTAIWYWMTQSGPGSVPAHQAITGSHGFGGTIRAINGALECDGRNPAQVQSRINTYQQFVQILGTTPGSNLSC